MKLRLVESTEDVGELMTWLGERREYLGFDIETGGLDFWREPVRLVQFGDRTAGWALPFREWWGVVHEILTRYREPMVAHNAKFDTSFMRFNECGPADLLWRIHDTRTMAHLLDSSMSTSLKSVSARMYGRQAAVGQYKLKAAMAKNGWNWRTVPIDNPIYWAYACFDTVLTSMVAEDLHPVLMADPAGALYETELAAQAVLQDMEFRGMRIDRQYLFRKSQEYAVRIAELSEKWGELNLGSHPQVADALMARGIKVVEQTDGGNWKMDKATLKQWDQDELVIDVLEYRKRTKLKGTYFDGLQEMAVGDIIHPNVNPLGARTSRMSCSRPNLQNQPRGREVRDAFIPRDEHTLVLADYANQEYRVFASYCRDPLMLQAFREGRDFHTFTTEQVLGTTDPAIVKPRRPTFKSVNFANVYMAGVEKLAQTAGISVEEAQHFTDEYHRKFTLAKPFQHEVIRTIEQRAKMLGRDKGMVRDAFGGRQWAEVDQAYAAVNYLVQGSCARVLKRAIVNLHAAGLSRYAVLPVHDEVIFDVPNELAAELVAALPDLMEDRETFELPLLIDINQTTESWGAAKE